MLLQTYLFFDGRCDEAIEFYKTTLGAEVEMLMRFKDAPPGDGCAPGMDPAAIADNVMHATIRIGEVRLMVSDGSSQGAPKFEGFSLTLSVADEAEAKRLFAALSDGGQVQMPLDKTFFSPSFGIVADRFGVSWMVLVASDPPTAP